MSTETLHQRNQEQQVKPRPLTKGFLRLIAFGGMGEDKAKILKPRLLVLRVEWPVDQTMVVEVLLGT
jgi:hypothetical protein